MSNQEIKRLTVKALLERKEQLKEKENIVEEVFIPSLDATILVKKPSRSLCVESVVMSKDDSSEDKADLYLVYHSVVEPNLKDPKLQEEFGCVEPLDIVEKIMDPGEVSSVAGICMNLAGYTDGVKLVKDLKN